MKCVHLFAMLCLFLCVMCQKALYAMDDHMPQDAMDQMPQGIAGLDRTGDVTLSVPKIQIGIPWERVRICSEKDEAIIMPRAGSCDPIGTPKKSAQSPTGSPVGFPRVSPVPMMSMPVARTYEQQMAAFSKAKMALDLQFALEFQRFQAFIQRRI